ncbi:MAG TPA: hypothetical protein DEB20_09190 [Acidimicrobiaceae bacterium]|nr:hypothetical protein [Acidimicrobiaceae bacterium]
MSERSRGRDWIGLVAAVVFVVVVIGVFSYLYRDHSTSPTTAAPGFNLVTKDSFNRASGPIAYGKNVAAWKSIRGSWSVAAGAAYVSDPAPLVNVVVINAGPQASVKASVSGMGRCGLVANFIDENDYLSLVRIEKYGVWRIERHLNGTAEVVGTVGGSKGVSATASIAVQAPIVTATVGEQHVSVSISDLAPGNSAGLYVADPNQSECAFDDVVITRPN